MIPFISAINKTQIFPPFEFRGINAATSSEKQAEYILGKGLVVVGAHPNSGRLWRLSKDSQLVYFVDGVDPQNWPIDKSYSIGIAYIASGKVFFPNHWQKAPIIKGKPGPFWNTYLLHLSRDRLLEVLHERGFKATKEKDGAIDIFGVFGGQKYYASVSYRKNGYIRRANLSLLILGK